MKKIFKNIFLGLALTACAVTPFAIAFSQIASIPQKSAGDYIDITTENDDDENNTETEEITYTYKTYYDYFIDNMDCTGVYDDNGNLTNVTISAEKKAEILSSDFTGSGTSTAPYQVNSSLGFWYMSKFVYLENQYVELNCDVILNDETFDENGNASGGDGVYYDCTSSMSGKNLSLNGNSHTIYGLYIHTTTRETLGLFNSWNSLKEIKNLNFKNVFCKNEAPSSTVSVIAAKVEEIINCNIYSGTVIGYVGTAFARDAKIVKDCNNYAKVKVETLGSGIICYPMINSQILNCNNYGEIEVDSWCAGGVVAHVRKSAEFTTIKYCKNYGYIHSNGTTGGIVGYIDSSAIIENCDNNGICYVPSINIGGIVGSISTENLKVTMFDCINYMPIKYNKNKYYQGELIGSVYNTELYINRCKIYSSNGTEMIGGILTKSIVYLTNCETNFSEDVFKPPFTVCSRTFAGESKIYINNLSVLIDIKNLQSIRLLRIVENSEAYVKNVYIKVNCNTSFDLSYTEEKLEGVIYENGNKKFYYGTSFRDFYLDWKTNKIGLSSLDGVGTFQGKITEEWLTNNGYVKKN